jgi:hypothetical protein
MLPMRRVDYGIKALMETWTLSNKPQTLSVLWPLIKYMVYYIKSFHFFQAYWKLNKIIQLNITNNAGLSKSRLEVQCFQSVYVIELLAQYGLEDFKNIEFVDKASFKCFFFNLYKKNNDDNCFKPFRSTDLI